MRLVVLEIRVNSGSKGDEWMVHTNHSTESGSRRTEKSKLDRAI